MLRYYEPASIAGMVGGSAVMLMKLFGRGRSSGATATPPPANQPVTLQERSGDLIAVKSKRTLRNKVNPEEGATRANGLTTIRETAHGERADI